jgi:hypothetical protein
MKAPLLYRIASVLLFLFAAGHTIGFRRVDPSWGVDAATEALKATRFDVQGLSRTYWGFYTGFGLFVTVLLLFTAALAWQYFFLVPVVFSGLVTLCLLAAAWSAGWP